MIKIRPVYLTDHALIDAAIANKVWLRSEKQWANHVDPECVALACKNCNQFITPVMVEETFLVLFGTTIPFFTRETFLKEELVIRLVQNSVKFSVVPQALKEMSQKLNLKGVLTGTLLAKNDFALAKMYANSGFVPCNIGLYFEN